MPLDQDFDRNDSSIYDENNASIDENHTSIDYGVDDEDDDEEHIRLAASLAGLQLPHMPSIPSVHDNYQNNIAEQEMDLPSLRLLVVADLDLASAAALAEYALKPTHKSKFSRVDMCLALGPFCRRQDLQPYLGAHTASSNPLAYDNNICGHDDDEEEEDDDDEERHDHDHGDDDHHEHTTNSHREVVSPNEVDDDEVDDEEEDEDHSGHEKHRLSEHQHDYDQMSSSSSASSSCGPTSPEEGAALEGLVTGALSQLESIVCRVLFCPGHTDPPTLHSTYPVERRLTPNSRNIQASWIPLAPGLGCAGFYDPQYHRRLHDLSQHNKTSQFHHHHHDHENNEYRYQLQRLVRLAPPPPSSSLPLFASSICSQTILVTTNHHTSPNKLSSSSSSTSSALHPSVVLQIAVSSNQRRNSTISSSSHSSSTAPTLCSLQGSVLHVGSLRHAGTFCFLDIALMECTGNHKSDDTAGSESPTRGPMEAPQRQPEYQWQVLAVDVLNLHD